ncbi:MAG: hypothetical protein AAGA73_15040 [Pseudomonadota bacterium]
MTKFSSRRFDAYRQSTGHSWQIINAAWCDFFHDMTIPLPNSWERARDGIHAGELTNNINGLTLPTRHGKAMSIR